MKKETASPPRLPHRFFRWYCHPRMRDYIEGDLMEVYERRIKESGKRKADWKFILDVLLLFRPGIIRPVEGYQNLNTYGMYKSYFKIGWRNLVKNKGYSMINIMGLAIGMTACLFIVQYARFEKSFDSFHTQANQVYRVSMDRYVNGSFKFKSAKTYPAIGPRLKENFPEVSDFVRVLADRGIVASEGTDQRYYEEKILVADGSFFEVFSFNLLKGEADKVLQEPNSIVLSTTMASKYFADEEAVGKTLHLYKDDGTQEILKVTGVFEDIPSNSHLQFDLLISYSTLLHRYGSTNPDWKPSEDSWQVDDYYTYVLLDENAQPSDLEEKLPAFFTRYKGDLFKERNVREVLHLQPIQDIHLYSDLQSEIGVTGNYKSVSYLEWIAAFIIIIAWINYVSLTTAKATERAKEVGLRKVFGSKRGQLINQFLFEAILANGIALALALVLYQIALPIFQTISGTPVSNILFDGGFAIAVFAGLTFLGIVLTALYPTLILSDFKPILALKGKMSTYHRGMSVRKSLVVFQFMTAILMLSGVFVIREQLSFMKNQDLGFDKERLLVVKPASFLKSGEDQFYEERSGVFKNALLGHSQIVNVTESGFVPGQEIKWRQGMVRRVGSEPGAASTYHVFAVDERFFETYAIEATAGRVFSQDFYPNTAVIVNEAAARQLGFANPEDAIGEEIFLEIDESDKAQIAGVIKNYHHLSLKYDVQPQLFFYRAATWSYFTVKVAGKNLPEEIDLVRKEFATVFPGNPFDYFFMDQFFDAQYKSENRFEKVFQAFSGLAIFISCLGLLTLSSYTIVQRTKEIGIHKVLGASVGDVIKLLSKDIIKLVLIAGVVAIPIAYLGADYWLRNYAFRIEVTWWLLVLPIAAALLLALVTISTQTIKAACGNPVTSLRSE